MTGYLLYKIFKRKNLEELYILILYCGVIDFILIIMFVQFIINYLISTK